MTTTAATKVKIHYNFDEYTGRGTKERSRTVTASLPSWSSQEVTKVANLDWEHKLYALPDGSLCTGHGKRQIRNGKTELYLGRGWFTDVAEAERKAQAEIDHLVLIDDSVYEVCEEPRVCVDNCGHLTVHDPYPRELRLTPSGFSASLSALPALQTISVGLLQEAAPAYGSTALELLDPTPLSQPPAIDTDAVTTYLAASLGLERVIKDAAYTLTCDAAAQVRRALDAYEQAAEVVTDLL